MLTWNLFVAELLKMRKMPINMILMGVVSFLTIFFMGAMTLLALLYGNSYIGNPKELFSYPGNLYVSTLAISNFSVWLSVIYAANSIGMEYQRDTWKILLPRYGSRLAFLSAKLAVSLLLMFCYIVFSLVFLILFSSVCALILKVDLTFVPADPEMTTINCFKALGISILKMCICATSTMLITVIVRSLIGGVIGGIGVYYIFNLLKSLASQKIAKLLPFLHIDNIQAHWFNDIKAIEGLTNTFGQEISTSVSFLVLTLFVVVVLGIMFFLFERRDMAGLG